jgi:hypothetical protein
MIEFLKSYQFLSVLGLTIDIIAILMMFKNPGVMTASGFARKSGSEKWGIRLLILGFAMQLASSIWSYCIEL